MTSHRKFSNPSPDFVRAIRPSDAAPSWEQYDVWLSPRQIELIQSALRFYRKHADHSYREADFDELWIAFLEAQGSNYTLEWDAHFDAMRDQTKGARGASASNQGGNGIDINSLDELMDSLSGRGAQPAVHDGQ